MKKFLIGCSIVTAIFLVLAIGSFVFCVSKFKQMANRVELAAKSINDTNAEFPFTEPADLSLTKDQLDRYFAVRVGGWNRLITDQHVSKMISDVNNKTNTMGVSDVMKMVFGVDKYFTILAEELRSSRMSAKEFQWTGRMLYLTIERGRQDKDPEYLALVDKIKANLDEINKLMNQGNQQNQVKWESSIAYLREDPDDVPEENLVLVREYFDKLEKDPAYYLELMLILMDFNQPQNAGNAQFQITPMEPATAE